MGLKTKIRTCVRLACFFRTALTNVIIQGYSDYHPVVSPYPGLQHNTALRTAVLRIFAAVVSMKLQDHVLQATKAFLSSEAESVKAERTTNSSKHDCHVTRCSGHIRWKGGTHVGKAAAASKRRAEVSTKNNNSYLPHAFARTAGHKIQHSILFRHHNTVNCSVGYILLYYAPIDSTLGC